MEDKNYHIICRIALARELGVPPDDLEVEHVLDMVESSPFHEKNGERIAKIVPETEEQFSAVSNQFYPIILDRIFQGEAPFQGFMNEVLDRKGII